MVKTVDLPQWADILEEKSEVTSNWVGPTSEAAHSI